MMSTVQDKMREFERRNTKLLPVSRLSHETDIGMKQ